MLVHQNTSEILVKCILSIGIVPCTLLYLQKYIIILLPLILFTCIVDAGVLLDLVTVTWDTPPASPSLWDNHFCVWLQFCWVVKVVYIFCSFYFQLCPNFQLPTNLLSLSISIGSVLFAIFWPNHLCIWKIMVEHGVYYDIDCTEWVKCYTCFSPYHLACMKDAHQWVNTLAHLWNVINTNFSFNFFSLSFI